ncbi:MAG: DUF4124 domain-containing protein [Gammaproteobacteria bacterium]
MKATLMILGILFSAFAHAGVYKCIDGSGKTVYRAKPCEPGQGKIQINLKTGSSTDLNEEQRDAELKEQELKARMDQEKQEQQLEEQRLAKLKQNAKDESAKNQFLVKNNPKFYSPFAIPPYDPDDLPPLVAGFQDKLPEIERLRRLAAEKALASMQCGRVESSELNIKSTSDSLVILVDCSSAQKFYFTEQELKQ